MYNLAIKVEENGKQIPDDKVYTADCVEYDDKGNVIPNSGENQKELSITHSKFQDLAGTIYNEMSKKSRTWEKGAGIYSVLEIEQTQQKILKMTHG
jgi:hypothetical protein